MKLLLCLFFCVVVSAQEFKKLELNDGRVYEGVTVTKKNPDGISIAHESGTARIKFDLLPKDVVDELGGFDKKAAEQFAREEKARIAAIEAAIDADLAQQKKKNKPEPKNRLEHLQRLRQNLLAIEARLLNPPKNNSRLEMSDPKNGHLRNPQTHLKAVRARIEAIEREIAEEKRRGAKGAKVTIEHSIPNVINPPVDTNINFGT